MTRICGKCGNEFRSKVNRLCKHCAADLIREMEDSGYLEPLPKKTWDRPKSFRENTRETKFGVDY